MTWLNAMAWWGLAAVAAPVVIHLLVQRRAERLPFPTLRFLHDTRLASMRRHLLDDRVLLAVRALILAAAVAAFAAPLVVTPARRAQWNDRLVRAVVVDTSAPPLDDARRLQAGTAVFRWETFEAARLRDGIHRARAWLETTPPARREIVVSAPFALGSLEDADVAAVPADVGLRFERSGTLPDSLTVEHQPVAVIASRTLGPDPNGDPRVLPVEQTLVLNGAATTVRETGFAPAVALPISLRGAPAARAVMSAALDAAATRRVWQPAEGRRASLVACDETAACGVASDVAPITAPWMADGIARIAADREFLREAGRAGAGLRDPRFTSAPWQTLAPAVDGRPFAAAAQSGSTLVVASMAPASGTATPLLARAVLNSLAPRPGPRGEVLAIPDRRLAAWTRPPASPASPRLDTIDRDDRRWLWGLALLLLALETWLRADRSGRSGRSGGSDGSGLPTVAPSAAAGLPTVAPSAKVGGSGESGLPTIARSAKVGRVA